MPTLLIYQELVALDRQAHRNLRLKKSDNLDFANETNSVPMAGVEFFEASREMPVLFTKGPDGGFVPIALLSLQQKGNNLGDEWDTIYIPAFIRRYPFAKAGDGNIVFDKQAPHLQEAEGDPLFKEDGSNSDFLNKIIGFLNYVDAQFKDTAEYCQACARHELFVPFNVQVNVEKDKPLRLDSLFKIDEKKLNGLPDEEVAAWFRKGWLAWSFAHLHSLGALRRLVKRERQLAGATETAETAKA